jgi:hypothetical protein
MKLPTIAVATGHTRNGVEGLVDSVSLFFFLDGLFVGEKGTGEKQGHVKRGENFVGSCL